MPSNPSEAGPGFGAPSIFARFSSGGGPVKLARGDNGSVNEGLVQTHRLAIRRMGRVLGAGQSWPGLSAIPRPCYTNLELVRTS